MLSNWRSPPRPGAKSPEQGRPYNRRHREVGRRREGGGWVRSSEEAEYNQIPVLAAAGYFAVAPNQRGYAAGARPDPTDFDNYRINKLIGDAQDIVTGV